MYIGDDDRWGSRPSPQVQTVRPRFQPRGDVKFRDLVGRFDRPEACCPDRSPPRHAAPETADLLRPKACPGTEAAIPLSRDRINRRADAGSGSLGHRGRLRHIGVVRTDPGRRLV